MSRNESTPQISLLTGWHKPVRSAILHVLSLIGFATDYTREGIKVVLDFRRALERATNQQPQGRTSMTMPHRPDADAGELARQRSLRVVAELDRLPLVTRQRNRDVTHRLDRLIRRLS